MFYIIHICHDGNIGQLCGPGTHKQCMERLIEIAHQINNKENHPESTEYVEETCRNSLLFESVDCYEWIQIIQADSF
jgi:hypothetical protein